MPKRGITNLGEIKYGSTNPSLVAEIGLWGNISSVWSMNCDKEFKNIHWVFDEAYTEGSL